MMVRLKNEAVD